ncbi:hypothetical protein BCA37_21385 [Mycobacterium sp. djl-10]|nr:hypothetical protein BCA37_21385 [Mycobacterium sp. djl-10]
MERFDIDAVSAFDLPARLSQQTNSKLSVVAGHLVNFDHPARGHRRRTETGQRIRALVGS